MNNSISNQNVIANIGAEMGRRRISQKRLAVMLGMSAAAMSDRQNGKTPWTLEELDRISEVFDVPVPLLLQGVPPFAQAAATATQRKATARPATGRYASRLLVFSRYARPVSLYSAVSA